MIERKNTEQCARKRETGTVRDNKRNKRHREVILLPLFFFIKIK